MTEKILHTIPPVFDGNSRVLILGTMPSPKSREQGFYYGHPQNRMWRVLGAVLGEPVPENIAEKRGMLLRHGIAMWDVLSECSIDGASDSSIREARPNDFSVIFGAADIRQVFTTGAAAWRLYEKLTGNESVRLPSTSSANMRISFDNLVNEYKRITDYTA